jgi:hypothetical protein
MSEKIHESTLSGIFGVLIATSGLVGSAFSRDPIYAVCSFVLAPIVIVWMNIGGKRSERLSPVREKAREGMEMALRKWKPAHSSLSTTYAEIKPQAQSNLTASPQVSETGSSAQTKLVDAPA